MAIVSATKLRDDLERRGFRLSTANKALVIEPENALTAADREQVNQFRADLFWLTQLRESQGLGARAVPNGHQLKATPGQHPSNGHRSLSEASEVGAPASNYDNKSPSDLVTEVVTHLQSWRNGRQPARALAHLALKKLGDAIAQCEARADFKIGVGIDDIMRVAESLLARNLVGDAYQWQPEHLERLRQRLQDGHELVDFMGPLAQPRLRRPDGTVYILTRFDD